MNTKLLKLTVVSYDDNGVPEFYEPLDTWIPAESTLIKLFADTREVYIGDTKSTMIAYAEVWVQEESKKHPTLILHDGIGEPGVYNPEDHSK